MLTTILGFYPETGSGAAALRHIRANGFPHSAVIQSARTATFASTKLREGRSHRRVVLAASLAAWVAGYAIFLMLSWPLSGLTLALAGVLPILAASQCWLIVRWADRGIDGSLIDSYRRWVIPGESLVIIRAPLERAGAALDAIRGIPGSEPATFLIRNSSSFRALPGALIPWERFATERLKLHAAALAETQKSTQRARRTYPLQQRLDDSEQVIDAVIGDLTQVSQLDEGVSLASEWLLDNAYIIAQHTEDVRRHLSPAFYDVLPRLTSLGYAGEPRVYELAQELVAHTEAEVHEQDLVDFVQAYQDVTPLTIAELWALPLMLRLALVESLARLATAVDRRQDESDRADFWANRLLNAARRDPDSLKSAVTELAREQPHPSAYLADRLVSQLQGEGLALDSLSTWVVRVVGVPLPEVIQQAQREQAAGLVAIANAIGSLRELSRLDWRQIVERVSVVERELAADPAGVYRQMDFETRDHYRAVVERIARRSEVTEVAVARLAVELARSAESGQGRTGHVGYYLVDRGRAELVARTRYRPSANERLLALVRRRPAGSYLGSISVLTVVAVAIALGATQLVSATDARPGAELLLSLLLLLPASELAVQIVNYAITRTIVPTALPKLALEAGIPDEYRTLVVVPVLLRTPDSVRDDLAQLEIRFLANRDPNLHYALLADLPDAPVEDMPEDASLLEATVRGVDQLNGQYPGNPFSLFYRERVWSASEQVWMGWERKRGKLEELNRWLLDDPPVQGTRAEGHPNLTIRHVGDPNEVRGIRFVLTLDADTQLPHGAAQRLVGILAHPLNRPQLAPDGHIVERGYSIIQPRVSTTLPSATASRFARYFAGPAGTDPYTHAISDVYQDLSGEGTYHGKGIYDLAAFHGVLSGRFPEATLLSHDLLEGAHVRVGLATDVELFDHFPSTYRAYAARQHRWTRGDWQIIDWCTAHVPGPGGTLARNPLSGLNRWKIFDNLRRSLLPTASVAMLLAGWLFLPAAAGLWSLLVGLVLLLPTTLQTASWLATQTSDWRQTWPTGQAWRQLATSWVGGLFAGAILPHQAVSALDAIARVWLGRWRSHRHALAWETSQLANASSAEQERRFLRESAGVSVFAIAVAVALWKVSPGALVAAAPFLFLWLACPAIVAWLSGGQLRPVGELLRGSDRQLLRRIARRTWRYFDDFVSPQTNWLPPDNYQTALRVEVAQRTSPTNIGLWLLSTLAANDLGYLTADQVIDRGTATMATVDRLERFEGHLLNWYDVQTAKPLLPRYVSTVDSGNLLASLWTLGQGYRELLTRPLVSAVALDGLRDALELVQESLISSPAIATANISISSLSDLTGELARLCEAPPNQLGEVLRRLDAAGRPAAALASSLATLAAAQQAPTSRPLPTEPPQLAPETEAAYWVTHFAAQQASWLDVVARYLPWISDLAESPSDLPPTVDIALRECRRVVLHGSPSLSALASGDYCPWQPLLRLLAEPEGHPEPVQVWLDRLGRRVGEAQQRASETLQRVERLIILCESVANAMNLRFLYDAGRDLFSIGYNVDARRLDPSHYDLLASESRLTSFVAIASGDVPTDNWLALGRPFGLADGRRVLLSWSGTMFEYLLPLVLTRSYDASLLDQACREAVAAQIAYGESRGVPWGISEAAYAAVDASQIYQYQAFGVPDLGLKRELAGELVVAPYATALALLVDPPAALQNLKRLARFGAMGGYGYYESIDYSPRRQGDRRSGILISTYMAHHQAMTLLAIDNALNRNVLQTRFHADPRVRAFEPLLFERIPTAPVVVDETQRDVARARAAPVATGDSTTRFRAPDPSTPRTLLLGNGSYAVMMTSAGGGYSRWRETDISRWSADTTLDSLGSYCYLRDAATGSTWSAAHQPTRRAAERYNVNFRSDRAEFERLDDGISSQLDVVVSTEDDAEIRRLTLVNLSGRRRVIEVTSYVELAMAAHAADRDHPAFSKMFIQTEALSEQNALLAWRKPRAPHDPPLWVAHVLMLPTEITASPTYETDRARFVGRGRTLESPIGLEAPLTNTTGPVLDPIFSFRCQVTLEPGERSQLAFVTGAGDSRERVLGLVEKYQDLRVAERELELAWFRAQLEPRHLRVTTADVQRFLQLAGPMLYPSARLRAAEQQLRLNRLGQSHLWAYGVSGDLPILLVTIGDESDLELVREVLLAHTFWQWRGFRSDLVILNEEVGSYEQPLQGRLKSLIQAHAQYTGLDQPGGIFLRPAHGMPPDERGLLSAVARVVLVASRGSLVQQLSRPAEAVTLPPRLTLRPRLVEEPSPPLPFLDLPYFNGLGGFTEDGKEYAIYLGPGAQTPLPWVNVMANPTFGCLVSESGQGFAWFGNSQSNRLIPWSNDPVLDPSGDALYLRDEESGIVWTPTALPIREIDAYRARHGQGYTVFEHNSHAIEQELLTFVPCDAAGGTPVRIQRLRLHNVSGRRRRLTATAYAEWVLGDVREDSQMHVVTSWDRDSQAIFARNAYRPDYADRVAFASASQLTGSYTADRSEFLGRNGSRVRPAALARQALAGRTGAGLDPCAAIQVSLDLDPGAAIEVTFVLGEAADTTQARELVQRFRDPNQVEQAYRDTRDEWDRVLGAVEVETPDLGLNFMLNRWLPYQTRSCRFWGRSAFYQSGGAFGFRDQLQDVMALVYADPQLTRQHILTSAARQFTKGDVQHWWHPQSGAGVRTRISDDLLWLPYVTAHYVRTTGDAQILDEVIPFLEGRPLDASETERYFVPQISTESASLLEHCRRAIAHGDTRGPHGLPLMGSGDWNDGLNLVGAGGKGESVWLAWFLIDVLNRFTALLEARGPSAESVKYRARATELAASVEREAWDGAWYRRAYFDDGTPLGSHENAEARIDSLPQSWSVISGAANPDRAAQALRSAEEQLVREKERLILLFTPPFEQPAESPGYVAGYPPGVRENGGQYTHGATWVALAFARRGDGDHAAKLLQILNPLTHARTPEEVQRYKVEPYVVAADVYALAGHVGMGGWTWYTGSSGWLYRAWLEEVLGFQLHGDRLVVDPVLPAEWPRLRISYRYRSARYDIVVENPDHLNRGVGWVEVDGQRQPEPVVRLQDDGRRHAVVVRLTANGQHPVGPDPRFQREGTSTSIGVPSGLGEGTKPPLPVGEAGPQDG